jgi:hypothetical protein
MRYNEVKKGKNVVHEFTSDLIVFDDEHKGVKREYGKLKLRKLVEYSFNSQNMLIISFIL